VTVAVQPATRIEFDCRDGDVEVLRTVAHHYETVIGASRHVLIALMPPKAKRKYRYIVQESDRLAQSVDELAMVSVRWSMDLDSAVAFWGRLLSNLNTKRSRRKLGESEAMLRQNLLERLQTAILSQSSSSADSVAAAIATRRAREQQWMQEALTDGDVMHSANVPHDSPKL
jgi:hypothetical protein